MGLPLVTATEYKAYAGIISNTQDATIAILIPKVSTLVKTLCRRTFIDFVNESKVEIMNGGRGNTLFMKEYPLIALGSFEYSTDFGATYTELIEFTDFAINNEDGTIVSLNERVGFIKQINGYKITYTAGYDIVPEDLKLAVFDLISYYMKNDMAIHSPKAPGTNTVQIEYVTNTTLPAHIRRVLDQYVGSYD